jgi:hypothetical protein
VGQLDLGDLVFVHRVAHLVIAVIVWVLDDLAHVLDDTLWTATATSLPTSSNAAARWSFPPRAPTSTPIKEPREVDDEGNGQLDVREIESALRQRVAEKSGNAQNTRIDRENNATRFRFPVHWGSLDSR